MSLWDQVKESFVELYSVAADKTGEAAKVGLRRYDKMGINWDVKRLMTELGGLVYHAVSEGRDDILEDPAVTGIVEQIKGLEAELQQKEQEITEIKHRSTEHGKQASAATDDTVDATPAALPSGELPADTVTVPGADIPIRSDEQEEPSEPDVEPEKAVEPVSEPQEDQEDSTPPPQ